MNQENNSVATVRRHTMMDPNTVDPYLEKYKFLPDLEAEDKMLTVYVHRLKIAVAVAVIRATPNDMTPRSYAESLVHAFSSDIDAWKTKCQKLEEDVFNLEQKMEIINLKEKAIHLCPSINILQEDSMQRNMLEGPNMNHASNKDLKDTIEFVRSFILLDSVSSTCSRPLIESDASAHKRNDIIMKSISTLLAFIRTEEGLKMEFKIVKQAVEEIHQLFNIRFGKSNQELVQTCIDFVNYLLMDIHKCVEINKVEDQHRRSALIQMIGEHKTLTALVLCRLLREITVTSDFLWGLFRAENDNFLPLLHAENTYYVLQSTEGLINIMKQQDSSLNALKIPQTLLAEWEDTTEKSLSDLGMHFPMYCIYVWHIKSLMKSLFTDNCDSVSKLHDFKYSIPFPDC